MLLKGKDEAKDQSYVLSVLNQDQLRRAMFPVGDYTKPEVRDLARRFGLPVASKHDSQDLCFLVDGDYRRFLSEHAPQAIQPGPILDRQGHVLGQHSGLPFYTIGQRKGLGITYSEPLFVLGKDPARNAVIVGPRAELGQSALLATGVNWMLAAPPQEPFEAQVKVRYKSRPVMARITPLPDGQARVASGRAAAGYRAGPGRGLLRRGALPGRRHDRPRRAGHAVRNLAGRRALRRATAA